MQIHQPYLGSDSQDMTNVLMQTAVGHISTQTRIAYRARAKHADTETSNKSKYLSRQIIFPYVYSDLFIFKKIYETH